MTAPIRISPQRCDRCGQGLLAGDEALAAADGPWVFHLVCRPPQWTSSKLLPAVVAEAVGGGCPLRSLELTAAAAA